MRETVTEDDSQVSALWNRMVVSFSELEKIARGAEGDTEARSATCGKTVNGSYAPFLSI